MSCEASGGRRQTAGCVSGAAVGKDCCDFAWSIEQHQWTRASCASDTTQSKFPISVFVRWKETPRLSSSNPIVPSTSYHLWIFTSGYVIRPGGIIHHTEWARARFLSASVQRQTRGPQSSLERNNNAIVRVESKETNNCCHSAPLTKERQKQRLPLCSGEGLCWCQLYQACLLLRMWVQEGHHHCFIKWNNTCFDFMSPGLIKSTSDKVALGKISKHSSCLTFFVWKTYFAGIIQNCTRQQIMRWWFN